MLRTQHLPASCAAGSPPQGLATFAQHGNRASSHPSCMRYTAPPYSPWHPKHTSQASPGRDRYRRCNDANVHMVHLRLSLLRLRGVGRRSAPGPRPVPLLRLLPLPPRLVAGRQRLRLPQKQRGQLRLALLLCWRLRWVSGGRGQVQQPLPQPIGYGRPGLLQCLQPSTVGVG